MDYFIKLPGDTNKDLENDANFLGNDNQFGIFWTGTGWNILSKMILEGKEDILVHIEIINEKGKSYSITQFLDIIRNLQIRIQK